MAITLDIFEDTGPLTVGRGANTQSVNNIGWKASDLNETFPYGDYPIIRPVAPSLFSLSYKKYNYLKISGTYPNATRLKFRFVGDINVPIVGFEESSTDKVRLYYKVTNSYQTPTNDLLDGTLYDFTTNPYIWLNLSPVGPNTATNRTNLLTTDTTYYSSYIVTQLYVEPGADTDFGNTGDVKIEITMDEFETGDV